GAERRRVSQYAPRRHRHRIRRFGAPPRGDRAGRRAGSGGGGRRPSRLMTDGEEPEENVELSEADRAAFRRLLDMLHTEHRFDFREYKTVSLLRRIRARMSYVH